MNEFIILCSIYVIFQFTELNLVVISTSSTTSSPKHTKLQKNANKSKSKKYKQTKTKDSSDNRNDDELEVTTLGPSSIKTQLPPEYFVPDSTNLPPRIIRNGEKHWGECSISYIMILHVFKYVCFS